MSANRFARAMKRLGLSVVALSVFSCSHGSMLNGKLRGLTATLNDAEKNGAMRCAPRELALAKAHLQFAATELAQGEAGNAERHLAIAEPNLRAAVDLSPPDRCNVREFLEVATPGDKDGDGLLDSKDKCPKDPENYNGFEDTDGCPDDPDTDGDGVGDSYDQCQLDPEDKDNYLDEDGCPDPDNDADGVADANDKCPNQAEDPDGYQDEDGCPDTDNDGDSLADTEDMCPNNAGYPGGTRPGCPKRMSSVVVTAKEIRITQQIQFVTNSATIRPGVSFKILDEVAEVLRDNPKITLEVQGHTDNNGVAAYNMTLSQKRAESVRNYLLKAGTTPGRMTAKGYGMTQPLVPNTSPANQALNRRVQFIRTDAH